MTAKECEWPTPFCLPFCGTLKSWGGVDVTKFWGVVFRRRHNRCAKRWDPAFFPFRCSWICHAEWHVAGGRDSAYPSTSGLECQSQIKSELFQHAENLQVQLIIRIRMWPPHPTLREEKGIQTQAGPDIFGWVGVLPCEGVGAKQFRLSFETQGNQTLWRIPLSSQALPTGKNSQWIISCNSWPDHDRNIFQAN